MKSSILKNGLLACAVLLGVILLSELFFSEMTIENFRKQEIFGYSAILLSTIFVFLGIKQYRDNEGQGNITFLKALMVGIGITAIPSLAFGLYNLIYVEFINPEFMDAYFAMSLEAGKEGKTAEEYAAFVAEQNASKDAFQSPVIQFFAMFITVFLVGLIVSILSSLVLKRAE